MMDVSHNLRVLVVDDEKTIRRFLKATLLSNGYKVFEASDGAEALENSVSSHPDAIILDLGLPDMDGLDVTRQIRKRSRTPIVILSVRKDQSDKIAALDAGADDYLTKPFDAAEMLARLRAVMRRLTPRNEQTVFNVAGISIDIAKHTASLNESPVRLTPTEYDVLKILVMNAGRVITHRQFLEEVWNKSDQTPNASHIVRVTINNLRDKIEPDPNRPRYILTEPGVGYRLRIDE